MHPNLSGSHLLGISSNSSASVFDADYFADNILGNNSYDGTTPTKAKATAVAALALAGPGKSVALIGNGRIYYETVTVGAGVTLKGYASQVPILSAAKLRTGWVLTPAQTFTYEIATADTINTCWQDTSSLLTVRASIALVEANAGSWYSDGAKLYVHTTGSDDPSSHLIETVQNGSGTGVVSLSAGSTLKNLIIEHGRDSGVLPNAASTISNCLIRHCRTFNGYGIKINAAITVAMNNTTIQNCLYGVFVGGNCTLNSRYDSWTGIITNTLTTGAGTNVVNLHNPTFYTNTVNPALDLASNWTITGILTARNNSGAGALVRASSLTFGVDIHHNAGYGIQCNGTTGININSGQVYLNTGAGIIISPTNSIVSDLSVYNNGSSGIQITGAGSKGLRNICFGNAGHQIILGGDLDVAEFNVCRDATTGSGIQVDVAATNALIQFNRVWNIKGAQRGIYFRGNGSICAFNAVWDCTNYNIETEDPSAVIARYNASLFSAGYGLILKATDTASLALQNLLYYGAQAGLSKASDGDLWQNNVSVSNAQYGIGLIADGATNVQNCHLGGAANTGNVFISDALAIVVPLNQDTGFTSDYNRFITCTKTGQWLGADEVTLANWQGASGQDANSNTSIPTTNQIFIDEADNANLSGLKPVWIMIWNWEGLTSVDVDLSALSIVDGNYTLTNALSETNQNIPITVSGHHVIIPMTGWTITDTPSPYPSFGVFTIS